MSADAILKQFLHPSEKLTSLHSHQTLSLAKGSNSAISSQVSLPEYVPACFNNSEGNTLACEYPDLYIDEVAAKIYLGTKLQIKQRELLDHHSICEVGFFRQY